jgi:phage terminase large subunit-like protein
LYFDHEAAERVYEFFEKILRLNGGQFEGLPFLLHLSQSFILGSLFGWKRKDGTRRFRRAYIEQGKGNGKTPLISGLGLYGMIADGEARAEIYAAASKRDQAMVLYRDARAMVQQSPELAKVCTISGGDHTPNIAFLQRASFFRPISCDKGQSGPRPHFALCDEVHEHASRDTMEMLERGFKFRLNPLLVMITNSGFDRETVCWEEHEHAVKVAAGAVEDDSTFSYVCALDESDDPLEDPSCCIKANPLLGVTITEKYLADIVRQAKAMPGKRNNILRLHFCVWTEAESVWIDRETWEACEAEFDPAEYYGLPCYGGLDLSAKRDLTADARVWRTDQWC